ncbi:MAG: hypothetical protein JJV93_01765 [Alphaproteobacteria bacterium]|nr:hypothetical protein [Alphaproteobacteria bacterium]MBL0717974.1 hypothetical protein [Alphaproteobacteria bacterium]
MKKLKYLLDFIKEQISLKQWLLPLGRDAYIGLSSLWLIIYIVFLTRLNSVSVITDLSFKDSINLYATAIVAILLFTSLIILQIRRFRDVKIHPKWIVLALPFLIFPIIILGLFVKGDKPLMQSKRDKINSIYTKSAPWLLRILFAVMLTIAGLWAFASIKDGGIHLFLSLFPLVITLLAWLIKNRKILVWSVILICSLCNIVLVINIVANYIFYRDQTINIENQQNYNETVEQIIFKKNNKLEETVGK